MDAETDRTEEVSKLIDFMSGINVIDKHLHIKMSSGLDRIALEEKTINFDVTMSHFASGTYK